MGLVISNLKGHSITGIHGGGARAGHPSLPGGGRHGGPENAGQAERHHLRVTVLQQAELLATA